MGVPIFPCVPSGGFKPAGQFKMHLSAQWGCQRYINPMFNENLYPRRKEGCKIGPLQGKGSSTCLQFAGEFPVQIPQLSQPPGPHKTNICRRPDVNPSNAPQQVFSTSSLLLFLSLLSHKHSRWLYLARWCSEVSLQMFRGHLGDVLELRAAPKAGISWLCSRKPVSPPGRPVLGGITHPAGLPISTLTPEQPAADHRPVFLTIKPSSLILILPLTLVVRSQGLLPADVFPGEQGGLFCPAATPELPGVWGVRCCSQGAQSDCATLAHPVTTVASCFQLGRELPYTEPERDTNTHAHLGAQVYF